jgi:hypothetical protein
MNPSCRFNGTVGHSSVWKICDKCKNPSCSWHIVKHGLTDLCSDCAKKWYKLSLSLFEEFIKSV